MKQKTSFTTVILSGILVVLLLLFFFRMSKTTLGGPLDATAVASNNEIILLVSESCSLCESIEPSFIDFAESAGLGFRKLAYSQPVPLPSYIVVHEGVVTIGSARNAKELKQQLCVTAGLNAVC